MQLPDPCGIMNHGRGLTSPAGAMMGPGPNPNMMPGGPNCGGPNMMAPGSMMGPRGPGPGPMMPSNIGPGCMNSGGPMPPNNMVPGPMGPNGPMNPNMPNMGPGQMRLPGEYFKNYFTFFSKHLKCTVFFFILQT